MNNWLPKSVLCLRSYTKRMFVADLLAGITVGLVTLPLVRMMNWQGVLRLIHVPRIEAAAWVATSVLMIVTDFPIAIAVGMLIGMFLYIRRKPAILTKAAPGTSHNP